MRVLHYKPTMRAEEGGVVKAVFDMCVLTASETLHVGLATHHTDLVRENLPSPASELVRLHPLPLPSDRSARLLGRSTVQQLTRVIDGYDLVHLHEMWTTSNPQIARICRRLNKPYILSVHGMLDDWCMAQRTLKKRAYLATWARHLLPHAARVLCTADAELAQAGRWFDRAKGEVIPLPMDLSMYWRLQGPAAAYQAFPVIDPTRTRVLFLSRLHHKKGVDRLIRASALLHKQGVDHQLLIAGTGTPAYTRSLAQLAQAEGVEHSTHFLGFVSGMLKVSLFQAADVFALPTSQENFGFVFFESLAAGTPVVTTRLVDTWQEMLDSGGVVLTDNTHVAFADAIADLLSSAATLRQRGCLARDWTLEHCRRDRVANRYRAMYSQCVGGPAA